MGTENTAMVRPGLLYRSSGKLGPCSQLHARCFCCFIHAAYSTAITRPCATIPSKLAAAVFRVFSQLSRNCQRIKIPSGPICHISVHQSSQQSVAATTSSRVASPSYNAFVSTLDDQRQLEISAFEHFAKACIG